MYRKVYNRSATVADIITVWQCHALHIYIAIYSIVSGAQSTALEFLSEMSLNILVVPVGDYVYIIHHVKRTNTEST